VRAALGAPPGTPGVPLQPVDPGPAPQRLERAAAVVRAGHADTVTVEVAAVEAAAGDGARACLRVPGTDPSSLVALGMAVQRLLAAAWAEDLEADAGPVHTGPAGAHLTVRARSRGV
jgi:hypothetical protein